jgi:hypothetical protein
MEVLVCFNFAANKWAKDPTEDPLLESSYVFNIYRCTIFISSLACHREFSCGAGNANCNVFGV